MPSRYVGDVSVFRGYEVLFEGSVDDCAEFLKTTRAQVLTRSREKYHAKNRERVWEPRYIEIVRLN